MRTHDAIGAILAPVLDEIESAIETARIGEPFRTTKDAAKRIARRCADLGVAAAVYRIGAAVYHAQPACYPVPDDWRRVAWYHARKVRPAVVEGSELWKEAACGIKL